ncbi:MAG: S9 family peptidase, partial [Acidobacteria bacterium]
MSLRIERASRMPARIAATLCIGLLTCGISAQDRLKTMPGYEQYQRMVKEINGAVKSGALAVTWKDGGKAFEYTRDGKTYRYDVAAAKAMEIGQAIEPQGRMPAMRQGLARGRQSETATSPDGKLTAVHRDRNLYITDAAGGSEAAVTTDGSAEGRIKYGTASWVYGEELGQTTAMWWSPDSTRLAYYRFDEKLVPDYFLQLEQTKLYSTVDTEAYPKAGEPNPVVELFVYDVASKRSVKVDVRDGKPFEDGVVGHYVYRISWASDGKELLFHRTIRRQNVLELVAANPATGACRVVLREEWPTGWVENSPTFHFLADGRRFIWESERNGWLNYYLYDLSGKLLNPVTSYTSFEAGSLVKVDEAKGVVFLMARDGDNYMKQQLHRVGLDGRRDVRLTDPAFNHSVGGCMERQGGPPAAMGPGGGAGGGCGISPDNRFFVDVYQTHKDPPATRLVDAGSGKVVEELAASDLAKFDELGLKKAEMFTYTAADGKTTLHGLISFPSNFDLARKYPALVAVYGGPDSASNTARETFVGPNATTEYGFLILNLSSRAAPGQGKRTLDSI